MVLLPPLYLTRAETRALDRRAIEEFGVPGIVLMENAGRGAAHVLMKNGNTGLVVICCGTGNNGGDGFVIARHLDNHDMNARVLLFGRPDELTGDAAVNCRILAASKVSVESLAGGPRDADALAQALASADWIVDALFGTGLKGAVRPPFDQVIEAINASGKRVLAVDIPSGLDCDTGKPLGNAVRAEHTATFVAPKEGFRYAGAAAWVGQLHVVDIGLPRVLIEGYRRQKYNPLGLEMSCQA